MVDARSQIQQTRSALTTQRTQIREAVSKVPNITQQMLRQPTGSAMMGRIQRRGILKQKGELTAREGEIERETEKFEISVAQSYPEEALEEYREKAYDEAVEAINTRLHELAGRSGKDKERYESLKAVSNLPKEQLIKLYYSGVDIEDLPKTYKYMSRGDVSQTVSYLAGGQSQEPEFEKIKAYRDTSGKIIGVEDPFLGVSKEVTKPTERASYELLVAKGDVLSGMTQPRDITKFTSLTEPSKWEQFKTRYSAFEEKVSQIIPYREQILGGIKKYKEIPLPAVTTSPLFYLAEKKFPESIAAQVSRGQRTFVAEGAKEVIEKPVFFTGLTLASAGVSYLASAVGTGLEAIGALKLATKFVKPATITKATSAIGTTILPSLYTISIGEKIKDKSIEEAAGELGRITTSEIVPIALGMWLGTKGVAKVKGYIQTRGIKTEIPPPKTLTPELQEEFLSYTYRQFPAAGQRLTPSERIGLHRQIFRYDPYQQYFIKRDIAGGFHVAPRQWGSLTVGGDAGIVAHTAPIPSMHFAGIADTSLSYGGSLLGRLYGKPQIMRIYPTSYVEKVAKEFPRGFYAGLKEGEKGVAYIVGTKAEIQSVILPETILLPTAERAFMKFKGVRVPVDVYLTSADKRVAGELTKDILTFGEVAPSYYLPPEYISTTPSFTFGLGVSKVSLKPKAIDYYVSGTRLTTKDYVLNFTSDIAREGYRDVKGYRPKPVITTYDIFRPTRREPPYKPKLRTYDYFRPITREPPYKYPPYKYPPYSPSEYPPYTPPIIPTEAEESKLLEEPKIRVKGFKVFIKRRGEWIGLAGILPRAKAIRKGEREARRTLAATFKVEEAKKFLEVSKRRRDYRPSPMFREFKIRKGKRIPLKDIWIQKAKYRLGTPTEVREIQRARKSFFQTQKKQGGSNKVKWF